MCSKILIKLIYFSQQHSIFNIFCIVTAKIAINPVNDVMKKKLVNGFFNNTKKGLIIIKTNPKMTLTKNRGNFNTLFQNLLIIAILIVLIINNMSIF